MISTPYAWTFFDKHFKKVDMIIGLWGDSFFDSGCGYWAREKNQKVINDCMNCCDGVIKNPWITLY